MFNMVKKLLVTIGFVAGLTTAPLVLSAPAIAQDWSYDSAFVGNNDVDWNAEWTETEDWTVSAGSEYTFNGGAGNEGEAYVVANFSAVGTLFGEFAYGDGDAYSNTLGGNYAEAEFHSGSLAAAGGYGFDNDGLTFNSTVMAGGAGGATTGLTYGTEYVYSNQGFVDLDYSLLNSGYYVTP